MTISYDAEALFGVVADGSDVRPNLIAGINSIPPGIGGVLELPNGILNIGPGGVPVPRSNIVLNGHNTSLHFTDPGPKFLVGDPAAMVFDVSFNDLRYLCPPFDDTYPLFDLANVRGVNITGKTRFKGVHTFMRVGGFNLPAGTLFFDGHIEGDMSPQHGHLFDLINMPGGAYLGGTASIEGNFNAGGHFVNSTHSRADGFTMNGGWTVRKFDAFFHVRHGLANWLIQNNTFDGFRIIGVMVDSEYESVNGFQFQNNHLAGAYLDNPECDARGILISRVAQDVRAMVTGNRIFDTACEAIWTAGEGLFVVKSNQIYRSSLKVDNGYAAIRIGQYSRGVCSGNVIESGAPNRHAYGINSESQSMRVYGNQSWGHATAPWVGNIEN